MKIAEIPINFDEKMSNISFIISMSETWKDDKKNEYPAYPYWGVLLNSYKNQRITAFISREQLMKLILEIMYHEYIVDYILSRQKEFSIWHKNFSKIQDDLNDKINSLQFRTDVERYVELMKKPENFHKTFVIKEITKNKEDVKICR